MWKTISCAILLTCFASSLRAQGASPTATRETMIQVGVGGSSYTLDYGEGQEQGYLIYADMDFGRHLGLEALYRNASIVTPHDIGENHALIGPRFHARYGRFEPYFKALGGTGTINFQLGYNVTASSKTYFIYALGGGVDFRALRHVNVRLIDYEFQRWPTYPPNGLTPSGASVGAAYVF